MTVLVKGGDEREEEELSRKRGDGRDENRARRLARGEE